MSDTQTLEIQDILYPENPAMTRWGAVRTVPIMVNPRLADLVEGPTGEFYRFVVTTSGDVVVADASAALHRDVLKMAKAIPYGGEMLFCGLFRVRLGTVAIRFQDYGAPVALTKLRSRLSSWQDFVRNVNIVVVNGDVGDTW